MAKVISLPGRSVQIADRNPLQITSSKCDCCGGDGWLLNEARQACPCSCQRASRIVHRIPAKYSSAMLADFKPATIKAVGDWLEDTKSPGLFLYGPTGTGKTHLAVAICCSLLEANKDVVLRSAARLYRELRDSFNTEQTESSVMREYVRTPWLLLDDVGAGAMTDFERRYLLDLLDQRQDRRTIITSNLSIHEISNRLDERIGSRLSEFTALQAVGADRRVRTGGA